MSVYYIRLLSRFYVLFFFKQKTAYEMRISDWSSDVCSSDLTIAGTNPYYFPATDWKEELFKDYTVNQRANFNVSGGGKVARYYFAGTYNKDNGEIGRASCRERVCQYV